MWPPPVSSSFPFDNVVGSGPAQQPRQEARVPGPTARILGQHRTSSAYNVFDLDFTAAAAGLPPQPLAAATDAAGSANHSRFRRQPTDAAADDGEPGYRSPERPFQRLSATG
eukprot:GHVU01119577.1.p3 GENE.GHVU01119577.1~~GHVU01119577.1.p3  ORF type:complete len:112 (+),score=11.88 GHVU01119577.1:500-835(+)